jgi:uncharacterized protein YjiS (DUF1127 family)
MAKQPSGSAQEFAWLGPVKELLDPDLFTAMQTACNRKHEPTMLKFDNRIRQFPYFELERQVRIERDIAVRAFMRDVLCAFAHWVRVLALRGVQLVRSLAAERSQRRAVFELQQFDDRALADMGLKRGEIEVAVRNGRTRHLTQTAEVPPEQRSSERAAA